MNHREKNTGIWLTSLAAMILLLHNIFPHDHHYQDFRPLQHDDLTDCLFQHTENNNPPLHCHAFNNTDINPSNTAKVEVPVSQIIKLLFSPIDRFCSDETDKKNPFTLLIPFSFRDQQYDPSALLLRAPPSASGI